MIKCKIKCYTAVLIICDTLNVATTSGEIIYYNNIYYVCIIMHICIIILYGNVFNNNSEMLNNESIKE